MYELSQKVNIDVFGRDMASTPSENYVKGKIDTSYFMDKIQFIRGMNSPSTVFQPMC